MATANFLFVGSAVTDTAGCRAGRCLLWSQLQSLKMKQQIKLQCHAAAAVGLTAWGGAKGNVILMARAYSDLLK